MLHSRRDLLATFVATCAASPATSRAAQEWQPSRAIEIVVPSAAGGGLDVTGRVLQKIMHDLAVTDQPINVLNKPGGGGVIGINYTNQHRADGHYLCVESPGLLTNELVGTTPIGLKDVTPVAQLVDEEIIFTVNASSPIASGKDLAKRLGADPASVALAMSSAPGGHSHICAALVTKAAGGDPRKLKTVFFNGGGEAVTALMGDHVTAIVTPASSILGPLAAGKVRAVAYASAKRLPGRLADVPTWQEQGIDVVFSAWRGLSGPLGMTAAQRAWWDRALTQITAAPEWTKFVRQNEWTAHYLNSAAVARHWQEEKQRLAEVVAELDLVRKS